MSSDEDTVGSPLNPTTSTPGERARDREPESEQITGARSASNLLRHQHSFEARYSNIIQKQIWETTINKDVMERQLNAYFPFSRSASLSKTESDCLYPLLNPTPANARGAIKARSLATTPTKHRSAVSLEKCEALQKQVKKTA